jgi:hypothetical protein
MEFEVHTYDSTAQIAEHGVDKYPQTCAIKTLTES